MVSYILTLLSLLLLTLLTLWLEYRTAGVSSIWWIQLIIIGFGFITVFSYITQFSYKENRFRYSSVIVLLILFIFGIEALNFYPVTPQVSFIHFYQKIKPGMTSQEVQDLLPKYFPANGPYRVPSIQWSDGSPASLPFFPGDKTKWNEFPEKPDSKLFFNLNQGNGKFDSEWLFVYFKKDRVLGSEYLPD